jgi:hypothetical protein
VADVTVSILQETEYAEWAKLVAESPDGSIYSTPEYLDALCRAGGGRFRIVAVRRGNELAGGVALYERDLALGRYVAPRLLLYYNGLVLRRFAIKYPSEQTSRQLQVMGALQQWLDAQRYGWVMLKCRSPLADARPFLAAGWEVRPGYSYVVQISDLAAAWGRVEQNLRRLVERCRGQGMQFVEDDDFATFYRLHALTMERKDTARYLSEDAFRQYYETLKRQDLCRLYHARLPDGQAIASQLVLLGPSPVSHTVSAAADPAHLKSGVNAFLRWQSFEALAALGKTANDLTDAALNPVTHFKSQLGGDLVLGLILERQTRRYRWAEQGVRLLRRARGGAAAVARRLLGRS